MITYQETATDPDHLQKIMVDMFCGGGGFSYGSEAATGKPIYSAVNHDEDAIRMHEVNHPWTKHFRKDIYEVSPLEATQGKPVAWAHFSPDCTHFSRAKGGTPVKKNIRGLAWVIIWWAMTVAPDIISFENVPEFRRWGPLVAKRDPNTGRCLKIVGYNKKGKPITEIAQKGERVPLEHQLLVPDKKREGELFRKFVGFLRKAGYEVEFKVLKACDYGAPTSRERLFGMFRRDGKPIVWPEATHADLNSEDVRDGKMLPYVSAADIIDWRIKCPSIFESKEAIKAMYGINAKRPLADNTCKRLAKGMDKFVLKAESPYIVPMEHMITTPVMTALGHTGGQDDRCRSVGGLVHTTVTKAETCIVSPALIQYHSETTNEPRGQEIGNPLNTVDTRNRYGLMTPFMSVYYGSEKHGQNISDPLRTTTTRDRDGLVSASLMPIEEQQSTESLQTNEQMSFAYISKGYAGGYKGAGADVKDPVPTVTAVDHNMLVESHVKEYQDPGNTPERGRYKGSIFTMKVKVDPHKETYHWPQIRDMLNKYCDYDLQDDEILLLCINRTWYFIADIGLRMLTPRELYRANGFPKDYIIEHDAHGKEFSKSAQVAKCGNAVPPQFATALVRANLPEYCVVGVIPNLAELFRTIKAA